MKKFFILILLSVIPGLVRAQEQTVIPEGYELVDSVIYTPVSAVDTAFVGTDIFSEVEVNQSQSVSMAMQNHLLKNRDRSIMGYRVRIFFDNSQNSRTASEHVLKSFRLRYPQHAVYRSYVNPYFKVTVGDFRNRTEAMKLLKEIKSEYPSAFIVKENINFPVVGGGNAYVTDTVRVLKRIDYFQL